MALALTELLSFDSGDHRTLLAGLSRCSWTFGSACARTTIEAMIANEICILIDCRTWGE